MTNFDRLQFAAQYVKNFISESNGPKYRANGILQALLALRFNKEVGRPTNEEDLISLLQFTGWGAAAEIFGDKPEWQNEQRKLHELLEPNDYAEASRGVLSSYYTDPKCVEWVWDIIKLTGFKADKHTRILDASAGMGYFRLFAPEEVQQAKWSMIDIDPVVSEISSIIHDDPEVTFYKGRGFQDVSLPENYFDLCISNVPFGSYKVTDSEYEDLSAYNIHAYFLGKKFALTRPGGLVCIITSTGIMDSKMHFGLLTKIASQGKLLLGLRLPSSTHKMFGTEVTTDLLLFQKADSANGIEPDIKPKAKKKKGEVEERETLEDLLDDSKKSFDWTGVKQFRDLRWYDKEQRKYFPLTCSVYFANKQDHVLGRAKEDRHYSGRMIVETLEEYVYGQGYVEKDYVQLFEERGLRSEVPVCYQPLSADQRVEKQIVPMELMDAPRFCYFEYEGNLWLRKDSEMIKIEDGDKAERIRAMVRLLDLLQLTTQSQLSIDTSEFEKYQAQLNKGYDEFKEKFGYIGDRKNQQAMEGDWRYYQLAGLETPGKKRGTYEKSHLFFKQTVQLIPDPKAETVDEALTVCLASKGALDIDWMTEVLQKNNPEVSQQDVITELTRSEKIFIDPVSKRYVLAEEYLSGPVVEKLAICKELNDEDDIYGLNIAALEMVQPKTLLPPAEPDVKGDLIAHFGEENCNLSPAAKITADIGANWIDTQYYQEFIAHLLGCSVHWITVQYVPQTSTFGVSGYSALEYNQGNISVWGNADFTALELTEMALNNKEPVVQKTVEIPGQPKQKVKDGPKTEMARAIKEKIKKEFTRWVWSDYERSLALTTKFNKLFNSTVERKYDGSHLVIPGLNPAFKYRQYQLDAIWQGINDPQTGFAMAVGSGKTSIAFGIIMLGRQLGLIKKAVYATTKQAVPQAVAEFKKMFPLARVLAPTTEDFQAGNRRKLLTAASTGDWDIIIIGHTQYEAIAISKKVQLEFLEGELDGINVSLKTNGASGFAVKNLQNLARKLENEISEIMKEDIQSATISWEALGADTVVVDEWSMVYKNLGFNTKLEGIAGLKSSPSKRARNNFVKFRWMQCEGERIGEEIAQMSFEDYATIKLHNMATRGLKRTYVLDGTLIRNSIAEVFIAMKTLMYGEMVDSGIGHFDGWAANFGRIIVAPEITSRGKFEIKARFSQFTNIPLLMSFVRRHIRILTTEQLREYADKAEDLKLPSTHTEHICCEPSEAQKRYMDLLVERAEAIKAGDVPPDEDNMLVVTTDGRKMCLDIRLVDQFGANHIEGKVNQAALVAYQIWKATEAARLTIAIFCDFATPKDNIFNAYDYIKVVLIALGVPKEEVVFIHDFNTSSAKMQFQDDFNAGKIRIVIGSTSKLGTAINIQRRLVAAIHVDAPWRPGDVEQRNGRIERSGNLCEHVWQLYMVTGGKNDTAGFDSYMYQTLQTKAKFIQQFLGGSSELWSCEDITDVVLNFDQLKALASGDPRIMRRADVGQKVAVLGAQLQGLKSSLSVIKSSLKSLPATIKNQVKNIDILQQDWDSISQLTVEHPGDTSIADDYWTYMGWSKGVYDGCIKKSSEDRKLEKEFAQQAKAEAAQVIRFALESSPSFAVWYLGLVVNHVLNRINTSEMAAILKAVGVKEDDGVEEDPKKPDSKVVYLPLRCRAYIMSSVGDASTAKLYTCPRELGEAIHRHSAVIFADQSHGTHRIGSLIIGEDEWKIILESKPNILNGYLVGLSGQKYKFNVVNSGHQTTRNLFMVQATVQDCLHEIRVAFDRNNKKMATVEPRMAQLQSEIAEVEAEMEPLVKELEELDDALGINKTDGVLEISTGKQMSDSESDMETDEDDLIAHAMFASKKSRPALWQGVEDWAIEELKSRADNPDFIPEWLEEIKAEAYRLSPQTNEQVQQLERMFALEAEEPVVEVVEQVDEPVIEVAAEVIEEVTEVVEDLIGEEEGDLIEEQVIEVVEEIQEVAVTPAWEDVAFPAMFVPMKKSRKKRNDDGDSGFGSMFDGL